MAAKPPKPPGSFLKSLLNQHNNKAQHRLQQQQNHDDDDDHKESHCCVQNTTTATTSAIPTKNQAEGNLATDIAAAKKNNCNCSNISIMHLFHEMKQEFPTLPDTIVAQCVNENCHQRENCIQMLKHELELNPTPAQSYPAKVLHPPNNNSNNLHNTTTTASIQKPPLQQKPLVVQQKPPLKPIKPTRTAPLQPPQQQQTNGKITCTKANSALNKNTNQPLSGGENLKNNQEVVGNGLLVDTTNRPIKTTPQFKQSMPTTTTAANSTTSELCTNENDKSFIGIGDEHIEKSLPRQRPTTLNLNSQLQKQQLLQRQRLNIQLQQRFQEQQNRQQSQNNNTAAITKPLRKAPLPPIAPKPSQLQLNHSSNTNAILNDSLHTSTSPVSESEISVSVSLSTPSPTSSVSPNTTTHHHLSNKATQPQAPTTNQQKHLHTKSPIRHRSVITLQPEPPYTRDFLLTSNLTSPTYTSTTPSSATSPTLAGPKSAAATKSSSSATSSPTASVTGSQKSFTSVNLTLRPPVSPNGPNAALQPSTIDITAGPGFSGASGGGKSLHYSSTSYDARLGYQQNFQITVTDECGVFTASRIRPQQQQQQQHCCLNQVNVKNDNQYDDNSINYVNVFLTQQQQLQQQQQFHNNNVVALQQNIQNSIHTPQGGNTSGSFGSVGDTSPYKSDNMCFPPQQAMDAPSQDILKRQKKKRDKLAAALREYKKRLGNVEQEINLLTGTIPTEGLSERLDEEITKLRRDCQDMLRSSNTFTQPHLQQQQELAINHQPQQSMYQQHQQPPQPFPRQKVTRPPQRPAPPRQTSLDIIQHHSQTTSPHTPPAASLPNLSLYSSLQLQQLQQANHSMHPYYHQQSAPLNTNFVNNNADFYADQSIYAEQDHVIADDADEYEEVVEQPWECNMCTFRNHPQLNICETCDNVRIIPGRLTNLSRALSASNCTNPDAVASHVSPISGLLRGSSSNNAINNSNSSSRTGLNAANGNLEHDTNLVQQQLQHFALHT